MALIKCKECGHQVSSAAPTCPNCGAKVAGEKSSNIQGVDALIVLGACFAGFVLAMLLSERAPEGSPLRSVLWFGGLLVPPAAALYYVSNKKK